MNGVVETHELTMRFGGVVAVNAVNFSLQERELRCLIGPNGAGKSTFFKCLTGQYRLTHENGRVLIRGTDVIGWSTHQVVRLGVGIKTQVPIGHERSHRPGEPVAVRTPHTRVVGRRRRSG